MQYNFSVLDYLIIAIYFVLALVVGLFFTRSRKGIDQYFLAGRSMLWFVIGCSLFKTTVSSEHVIGYAESGYLEGFVAGNFAWEACFIVLILGWFFAPIYVRNRLFTVPEFIEKRFGENSRWFISVLSIVVYVITKISVTLFSGAIFFELFLGWDRYTSSLVLVLISGMFTLASGFRGLLYTHIFHTVVLIFCAIVITISCIHEAGGLSAFRNIPPEYYKVFKPVNDQNYPWTGMLLGAPILGIWYWCTDQFMVQRILSAKNIQEARRGSIFAGYLMLITPLILMIPGLMAYVKYGPNVLVGKTYYTIVSDMVPPGIKALGVAALLSALISALAACFNSTSTLFTLDVYKKLYPNADEFKTVTVGRLATIVSVIIGVIWVSFMGYFSDDIIKHLQAVQSYIAPLFTAIFLVGLIWPGANGKAAYVVMIIGSVLGFTRLALDIFSSYIPTKTFLYSLMQINFLHQAFFLFLLYVALMVIISLLTGKPKNENIHGVTFKYRHLADTGYIEQLSEQQIKKGIKTDIISSVVLAVLLLSLWIFLMI
ncbi:MAG: sodium/solute symporter [Cytophagaceae bacterium]|nr:sodium/solute symporter [Cytophagaceae bacterium]MDW8456475.1 sodium/solute symporter [Cytophagaceae bacterium]